MLVADDFGVIFYNMESLEYLINDLQNKYEITMNMEGNSHM